MGSCNVLAGSIDNAETGKADTAFIYFSEAWHHNLGEGGETAFAETLANGIKNVKYDGRTVTIGDDSPLAEADFSNFPPKTKDLFERGIKDSSMILTTYALYSGGIESLIKGGGATVLAVLMGVWSTRDDNWLIPPTVIYTDPFQGNDTRELGIFVLAAKKEKEARAKGKKQ